MLSNRGCLSLPKKPPPIVADIPSQNQFDAYFLEEFSNMKILFFTDVNTSKKNY